MGATGRVGKEGVGDAISEIPSKLTESVATLEQARKVSGFIDLLVKRGHLEVDSFDFNAFLLLIQKSSSINIEEIESDKNAVCQIEFQSPDKTKSCELSLLVMSDQDVIEAHLKSYDQDTMEFGYEFSGILDSPTNISVEILDISGNIQPAIRVIRNPDDDISFTDEVVIYPEGAKFNIRGSSCYEKRFWSKAESQ